MHRWLFALVSLFIAIGVSAQDATPVAVSAVPSPSSANAPLVLAPWHAPTTLDPLYATTSADLDMANALFIGLTRVDPVTGEIIPGLAQSWTMSEDGLTWTFTLRADVPWVRYDSEAGLVTPVRPVTADDALYAIQRLCSSDQAGYYAVQVFAPRLAGCGEGQAAGDGTRVQASAPDATTLTLTLTAPQSSFLSLAALWTIRPLPRDVISTIGANWVQLPYLLTNGPYHPIQWDAERAVLIANPALPADLWHGGNVGRITMDFVSDVFDQFGRYRRNQIDMSDIPLRDWDTIREAPEYEADLYQRDEPNVIYLGFMVDQPPFDDVRVRRALAASIDRYALVSEVLRELGTPIAHFIPPRLTAAAPLDAPFDLARDEEYAKAQLAESDYADCTAWPAVRIVVPDGGKPWADALVQAAVEVLGCDAATFTIQELPLPEVQTQIDPSRDASERPQIFGLGWGADYADADSFAVLLECGPENPFLRPCDDVDALIQQARVETDLDKRVALYAQIETAFFGKSGQFPMIPLFLPSASHLRKPWLSGPLTTDGLFGGVHYDAYTIDLEALAAGRVSCDILGVGSGNLRTGPGTTFAQAGKIQDGDVIPAVAQTEGTDGYIWWQLATGDWVRNDVIRKTGDCANLPQAFGDAEEQ